MQLTKAPKNVSNLFVAYLKSTYNFENFAEKDEPLNLCIS